jgi:hypothetical protein
VGWSNQVVYASRVIISGPGDALYVYDGPPAGGNLVASVSDSQGNDGYGNYHLPGNVNYGPVGGGGFTAVQDVAGTVNFWFTPNMVSVTNPWTGIGGIAAFNGTPNVLQVAPGPVPGDYIAMAGPVKVTGGFHYSGPVTAYAPGGITDEAWNAVTVPAGMTGTVRVKLLAEAKTAMLEIDVTITSTLAAGNAYTAGSLPSAGYYPQALRKRPLATDTNLAAAVSTPRVHIPTSGAVSIVTPAYNAAGGTAGVSGTVIYALD